MDESHLLLGVTASVAAIKTPELVNELGKSGHEVRVIVTENAIRFFDPEQLSVPIYHDADEWSSWSARGDPVLHIELRNWANLLLLAPLSANTMAKLAYGYADNLLTTLSRSWWFPTTPERQVFFAPAMNTKMWQHPFTSEQIDRLTRKLGWICIPPVCKTLMCGEHGIGAMAEVHDICTLVNETLKTERVQNS
ncbi:hypothetical protein AHF37_00336 [Paragonimus kellicotti]|nr:hypothetical protein AHF37_00336 [Paragonimus kellicotti]